ncbi:dethiobiotin synthase [Phormidium sp. FACHB-1136]|uniref:dethiobiotin synthase n=1 Tax=Phormidium sp. FACHB-1136 TaxID=2692848 RepID=UPI001688351A|nr:dethiobiotin synthase [Phormidium sp. FACHB-1136]MBD2427755.1 ATP-dependent dethiobiotin synthetase BioD [Phormidium sp. FACHB-1136]
MVSLNALLIAGTDTEVGKTVVTSALLAYWRKYYPQQSVGILKPLQSGLGDRELYQRLFFPELSLDAIAPQSFEAPLAPPLAAALEQRPIDLGVVWHRLQTLMQTHDRVLVEGLGGLGSPVTDELTVAALAAAWRLPVVLVVPVKLGAMAQAVANVALARQENIDLCGIILNCNQPLSPEDIDRWAPAEMMTRFTQVPVLGVCPYLEQTESLDSLAQAAKGLHLEMIPKPSYPAVG